MAGEKKTHYTAMIEVTKVAFEEAPTKGYNIDTAPATREVSELARVIIRSSTLEGLILKANAHLVLIEE